MECLSLSPLSQKTFAEYFPHFFLLSVRRQLQGGGVQAIET